MAPIGKWVFFGTGVDSVAKKNYGFRYYLNSESSSNYKLATRTKNFYTLNYPTAQLNIGGVATDSGYPETHFGTTWGTLQYVRLFFDYTPTTVDEFINIATMEAGSKIFFLSHRAINFSIRQNLLVLLCIRFGNRQRSNLYYRKNQ